MKHTLLVCLLLAYSLMGHAQYTLYDSATRYKMSPSFDIAMDTLVAQAAANPADTGEDNPATALIRYQYFMGSRISLDVPAGADMVAPMSTALSSYMAYFTSYCPGSGFMGNWQCLGPFTNYYNTTIHQGRIVSIWVNPLDSNTILAGADGGGLWKSTNDGHSWHNITGGTGSNSVLGMPGVYGIAVDPLDTNIIYISLTADGQDEKGGGYSLGLAYTTDGGNTWNADTAFAGMPGTGLTGVVQKVAYMPGTEQLFVICNGRIFYKASPSGSWTEITLWSPASSEWCEDMQFSTLTPGTLVLATATGSLGYLWSYNVSAATSSYITTDMTSVGSGYPVANPVRFSLSAADTAYIDFKISLSQYILVKTPVTVFAPTILNDSFPSNNIQFAVSAGNSHVIYGANYSSAGVDGIFTQSTQECTDINGIFPEISSGEHSDGRSLYIWKSYADPDSDVVYFGCDGGICKKRMGHTHTQSITGDSLAITQFYGFGNTEANENIMAAGAQDDGGFAYIKTNPTPWSWVEDGDAYTAKFMANGIEKAIGDYDPCGNCYPFPLYGLNFTGSSVGFFGVATPGDISVSNINRPIYFAPNNTGYVGYSHIWKTFHNGSSWTRAFAADPIDGASYVFPKAAADFYIDENDSNNVYVVYKGTGSGTGTTPATNDTFGRLYFTHNATNISPSPLWNNITPSIVNTNNITSIAVDPNNFGRIWVAFGNVNNNYVGATPDTMMYRVWHSEDTGSTWTDVSTGLPALPVEKLLYRKGSNDEIYAGTDVGVFEWNAATGSWQCFNNGLPPCIVMDMEFNYCAGKLRIATYGRGIWESPLDTINIGEVASTAISANTTWNENLWLQTSVDVQAGAILTIRGDTIHMPKNGVINVEPGGKLIIDSAVITNDCSQCFWQGIVVKGSFSSSATINTTNDGWVTMNGGTIMHARVGVSNYDSSLYGAAGIVQATGSSFVDCNNAVTLSNYIHATSGGTALYYPCYFNYCNFLLDNNYKGGQMNYPMLDMVSLDNVNGVAFQACNFLNRDTAALDKGLGNGIKAVNSGFDVSARCPPGTCVWCPCSTPNGTRFCGFVNGISVSNVFGGDFTVSIDRATFDSVGVGVNVSVQNNVSVTEDTFRIGNGIAVDDVNDGCFQNIGVLTQNVSQFRIEANDFEGSPSGKASTIANWHNIGAVAVNTGSLPATAPTNTVYRNTFDSLEAGVYAYDGNFGLHILCNIFSNNNTDILVSDDNPTSYAYYGGINWWQGTAAQPAGNTFSNSVKNIANDALTVAGFPASITYYWDSSYISTEFPAVCHGVTLIAVNAHNSCPATFGGPPIEHQAFAPVVQSGSSLNAGKQAFLTSQQIWAQYSHAEDSLTDFGNTDSLVNYIDTVTDTNALYATLLSGSPFLSAYAAEEMASMGMLSDSLMTAVLEYNPDLLRNPILYNDMQANYSFTDSELTALTGYALDSFTAQTAIEDTINNEKVIMDNAANIIMMALKTPTDTTFTYIDSLGDGICTDTNSIYYMLDSNGAYSAIDTVNTWLQQAGELWTYYERTGYYNQLLKYPDANRIFKSISKQATAKADIVTYGTMANIWDVLYRVEKKGIGIPGLDNKEIKELDTSSIAVSSYNTGLLLTYTITNIINPGNTIHVLALPCLVLNKALRNGNNGGDKPTQQTFLDNAFPFSQQGQDKQFYAFPNPTNGIVTFYYNEPNAGMDIRIVITNVVGQQVAELHTGNNSGKVYWDPGGLPAGMYTYHASGDNGVVSYGKIVIAK